MWFNKDPRPFIRYVIVVFNKRTLLHLFIQEKSIRSVKLVNQTN